MATEPDLTSISKTIDLIAVEVAKHSLATAELRKEVVVGFGRVNNRLGRLESRIEGVETGLQDVETRLENVETRLQDVDCTVKAMRGDITDLKSRSH